MEETFDISIVVSSYNRDNKVLQTIERLFNSDLSTFRNIELIVIDDGSPSPVAKLLEQLTQVPSNVQLRVITQKNAGIGATRNRGFREAKSNIVIFLDDDILLYPDTIKKLYKAQQEGPGPVIFGNYPFISHASPSLEKFAGSLFGYDDITTTEEFEKVDAITSGLLCVDKTRLADSNYFYKDDLGIPAAEEHELISRYNRQGIPIFQAKHIAAIHNHHLELKWLAQQQYKYGLATAEAFIKNPEIASMPRYAELLANMNARASAGFKNLGKTLLASGPGKRLLFTYARTLEKLLPKKNHSTVFGMLTSAFFRAGYKDGLKRFAK